ncbi:MAG: hypothetical protein ACHQM6_04255 [Candidatus Kapaibacterium sp.]
MLLSDHHSAKEDAIRILSSVKDSENFEDILYQMYVRKKVEQGLKDIEQGNIVSDDEMAAFWERWSEK